MKLLIDADIVAFRAAFSAEEETEEFIANGRASSMLDEMLAATGAEEYELWLSGKGNFRYTVFPEYKANRIKVARPKWEHEVKAFLTKEWQANWSEGCEADDMLGIRQMEAERGTTIITSIDKDLLTIPGWHYNFVKKEKKYVEDFEALRWLYTQLLIGDAADGVKGASGIGPKKAEKLLSSCTTEQELFERVRDAYGCDEEMLMNGRCLYIWRKHNDKIEDRWEAFGFQTD